MKKIFFITILVIFLFYSLPVIAQTEQATVRVGVYNNYPKIYQDENGEIKGFWADIVSYIAQQENWNLIYVFDTWENGLARLEKGEVDLMVDVAISEDRKQKYDFNNETVLISWGIFYTRQGLEINSFYDLQDKSLAILESSIHYESPMGIKNMLASFGITADVITVKEYNDVFRLLDEGIADVGVVSWYFGLANEDKYKVDRTNIMFNPSELKFAQTKDSDNLLLNVIDYHLVKIKEDRGSVYYKAIQTHFGKSLEKIEVLPVWLKYLLYVFAVLILGSLMFILIVKQYNAKLKREIERQVKQIKANEQKYSAVVNEAQDGVLILQNGTVEFANQAMLQMTGCSLSEMVGQSFTNYIHSQDQKIFVDSFNKILVGERLPAQELVLNCRDGKEVDISLVGNIVNYGDDKAVVFVVRNISFQKQMEKQRQEIDSLKTKFIEVVSHQLRTPLSACRWNLESLLARKDDQLVGATREIVQNVLDANLEVINRIGDLLTALDIEENRFITLYRTKDSLENIWQSVIDEYQESMQMKKIEFIYQSPKKKLPEINNLDVEKIKTCFERLLHNAIAYSREKSKITASLEQRGDKVLFKIIDTGIGIPLDEQKNIGTRFFRASNASQMMPDASGLGLFISKYFIKQHGGKFGFESDLGTGSTFWFQLPINIPIENINK